MSSPRIIAVAGPLEGAGYPLGELECSIGRDRSNHLVIAEEPSVWPKHCVIRREGTGHSLIDLGSPNGTFVNGLPVKKRKLLHGDVIRIGDTTLLFVSVPTAEKAMVRESDFMAGDSVELQAEESFQLQSRRILWALEKGDRVAAELNALFQISKALNETDNLRDLGRSLLDHVLQVIPAERSALLLVEPGEEALVIAQLADRSDRRGGPLQLSRTVVAKVIGNGLSLLCNNVEQSGLSHAESLKIERIRSLLCVPLRDRSEPLGLLYLDTKDVRANFDRDHLSFLTAVASIATSALLVLRRREALERECRRLRETEIQHGMVGDTEAMRHVFELIARVAPTDSTVLIRGESGTGKDLAARAIHAGSPRADKPFLALNCASLSETLIESELFGHEKGAFTGAVSRRVGKLEAADGGTVFLDEIGELPTGVQSKLLRALETREFEPLGGNRVIRVDIRLIAATNRDLAKAIEQGDFRQDLFYRLNVISFSMPPLRERRSDIPLLASHFARLLGRRLKRPSLEISQQAHRCMMRYDWPGNVRELANAVERAAVLAPIDQIRPEDLPEALLETGLPDPEITRYHDALNQVKKRLILEAVDQAGGNVTKAAGELGLHPNYLHRLIRSLGLKKQLG